MKLTMKKFSVRTLTLSASVLFGASPAFAQTAEAPPAAPAADPGVVDCAAAYESAQTERQAGHFRAASNQAMLCSQSTCNQAIVRECISLFESIQAEMPSMVFSARRADGGELTAVRVEMDGQPLLDNLDGKALALDPGAHVFKFITEGFDPKEISHTARVGDRNRLIEVVFGELPPPAPGGVGPGAPGAAPPAARSERGIPVASYVLAGVGAVALGTFGYMRISGVQDYNELNQSCSPECDPADVDPIRSKFQYSYVALGVGAAALAAATVVYFTVGDDEAPAAEVGFGTTPSGAEARLRARF